MDWEMECDMCDQTKSFNILVCLSEIKAAKKSAKKKPQTNPKPIIHHKFKNK